MEFKCIFFDFDGVIIKNSQILFLETMRDYLFGLGLDLQLSFYIENFLGWKGEQIMATIEKLFDFQAPPDLLKKIREAYGSSLINRPELDTSLYGILDQIETQYICSSNNKPFINKVLEKTNLKQYFHDEHIFSLENTEKVKPDPMVYLNAFQHCGMHKEECCAIEDSAVGIIAAKNAGIYTFGYTGSLVGSLKESCVKSFKDTGVDRIINTFSEI